MDAIGRMTTEDSRNTGQQDSSKEKGITNEEEDKTSNALVDLPATALNGITSLFAAATRPSSPVKHQQAIRGTEASGFKGFATYLRSLSASTSSVDSFSDASLLPGKPDKTDALLVPDALMRPESVDDSSEDAFLLARLHSRQKSLDGSQPIINKVDWFSADQWQSRFLNIKQSVLGTSTTSDSITNSNDSSSIDWDFWGAVINDYDGQLRKQPRQFTRRLHKGIPAPVRGLMWQLMADSKSEYLEQDYIELLSRNSRHEKIIQRDLARTFPKHEYFKTKDGIGQKALMNVLKAYSIFDQEIGYCQGIAFIVGPLLLNMPEEQVFCVLVKLMQDYGFRDLFSPKMIGLQLRNYQFDKLIEQQFPLVFKHLTNQDIKSTMYASQWFMTLFAYRFPLDMVFRIMDIVLAEGSDSVLRFSVALIKHNQDKIMSLDFEPLLEFLKVGLFDMYIDNIDQLVQDAAAIRVSKSKLSGWAAEFHEMMRKQSPDLIEAEQAKEDYRKLMDAFRRLEVQHELLNRDHIDTVSQLLHMEEQHDSDMTKLEELDEQLTGLRMVVANDRKHAEDAVQKEMDSLAVKNADLTRTNAALQDEVIELSQILADTKMRLATAESEKDDLKRQVKRGFNFFC